MARDLQPDIAEVRRGPLPPDDERDPALSEKLAAERSGILTWAVHGWLECSVAAWHRDRDDRGVAAVGGGGDATIATPR